MGKMAASDIQTALRVHGNNVQNKSYKLVPGQMVNIEDPAPFNQAADLIDTLQQRNAALVGALKLLHDNLAEYQRINKLGGYDNHDMKMARTAIAANGGGDD